MKITNALLFLLLMVLVLALSGSDDNPISLRKVMRSNTPYNSLGMLQPSPSGWFTLDATEKPPTRVFLKDAKGIELDSLPASRLPALNNFIWSPDSNFFCFTAGMEDKACLYVYSIQARQYRQVARGAVILPQWSVDGHYLACLRQEGLLDDLPFHLSYKWGTVVVLDVRRRFQECFTTRDPAGNLAFSPDGKHLAYEEMRRDSTGVYGIYTLKVAEMATGRAEELVSNRREPDSIWTGNTALAAVTYDKYAVPTLSLVHLNGKRTALVTAPEYAWIQLLEYEAKHNRILYEVKKNTSRSTPGDFWQVQPGTPPSPLLPNDPAVNYCRAKAEERIWAGL